MPNRRPARFRRYSLPPTAPLPPAPPLRSNYPEEPNAWLTDSDPWGAGDLLGLVCDKKPGGLTCRFLDEFSRFVWFNKEDSENPWFPRKNRSLSVLSAQALSAHQRLRDAIAAANILEGALSAAGVLSREAIPPVTIAEAIKSIAPPSASIANIRKVKWERFIPIVHLAVGVKIALALNGIVVGDWDRSFWLRVCRLNGRWLDLALQIASERRQQIIAAQLIDRADERLLIVGRSEATLRHGNHAVPINDRVWDVVKSLSVKSS